MYMRNLLHVWRANMDCQICLDPYSVINYIVNYINKENRGLSLNLDKVAKECQAKESSTKETIKALGNVFVNTSEVSIQECIYIILGIPLTYFSVDVYHIPTFSEDKRTRVLKTERSLAQEDKKSHNIFTESKFDKYIKRPLYFEEWCLADYTTFVTVSKRSNLSLGKEPLGYFVTQTHVEVFNTETHRYKIGSQKVLSYVCKSRQKDRENYYRIQLLLFHPWRVEITSEKCDNCFEKYFLNLSPGERRSIIQISERYNLQKLDDIEALYKQLLRDASHLTVTGEIDHINADDIEQGSFCLTDGSFFQPVNNSSDIGSDSATFAIKSITDNSSVVNNLWPTRRLYDNVKMLNDGQRLVFDHVMKHVVSVDEPLYLFITGGAGTGKSLLLHTLYHSLSRFYNLQPNVDANMTSVLCLASTGKAAYLIRGFTVHSGLHIKARKKKKYVRQIIGHDQLNTLRYELRYLRCILIDEVSMIGSKLFREVDLRLQRVFGNYLPFGGKHVICYGDLYQLPPVLDCWIFEHNVRGLQVFTSNPWTEYFKVYELTETMRQLDGTNFADLLNRMRVNNVTQEDIDILKSREITQEKSFDMVNVQHIYSTNDAAKFFNGICFDQCLNKKYYITSVDRTIEKLGKEDRCSAEKSLRTQADTNSLERTLEVAIGLIYEVTHNLNVQDGLVNGAAGYLRYVQFSDISDRPMALWFEFEEERIGENQRITYKQYRDKNVAEIWAPIFAYTSDFVIEELDITVQRTQFPIKQSTGKTVHKSQGSTVPKVVVDLSNHNFRNGYYVACSRVKKLEDLYLVNFHESQIISDSKVTKEMERLRANRTLDINCKFEKHANRSFAFYYLNAQSLFQHFNLIKCDKTVTQCNVLLFNETHLTKRDDLKQYDIPGYDVNHFITSFTESGRRKYNGLSVYFTVNFGYSLNRQCRVPSYEYILFTLNDGFTDVQIGLFYVKPNTPQTVILSMFHELNDYLPHDKSTILMGDLNINILEQMYSTLMTKIEIDISLRQIVTSGTTRQNTGLDVCFTNVNMSVVTHYVPWSYHFALTCEPDTFSD